MAPSQIYFFLQEGDFERGLTKIGIAQNPWSRIDALQTGNPYRLACIGAFPGTTVAEKLTQYAFRDVHVRGEWFALQGSWEVIDEMYRAGGFDLAEVTGAARARLDAEQESKWVALGTAAHPAPRIGS